MRSGIIYLLAFCAASTVLAEQFSFDGYKVWSVSANTEEKREALLAWEDNVNVDFWEPLTRSDKPMRIMIAPNTQTSFVNFLQTSGIDHELIVDNVETVFAEERRLNDEYRQKAENRSAANGRFVADFNHFWSTNEINTYLTFLIGSHGDIVSTEVMGFSHHGQLLRALIISRGGGGRIDGSRPVVFIDAGIHAREWVAHISTLYMIHQLVERRNDHLDILDNVDFVFLPIVNPDGYDYSQNNYRLWRKTRKPTVNINTGTICYGIDGNRNFAHEWRTSYNPCSDTYSGTAPFSEPETQAIRNVLERYGNSIKMYVTMHTYGQYVLYPWGYDRLLIDNWELHDNIGHIFADAIFESTGTNYTVGNSAIALYPAYGSSDDYASSIGVEASFTFELPGGGIFGFDMPISRINEVVTETWTGFRELLRFTATHEWHDEHEVVFPTTTIAPEE